MKLSDLLYKAASSARMAEVASTGDPKRIAKYAKNRMVSRFIRSITRGLYR